MLGDGKDDTLDFATIELAGVNWNGKTVRVAFKTKQLTSSRSIAFEIMGLIRFSIDVEIDGCKEAFGGYVDFQYIQEFSDYMSAIS